MTEELKQDLMKKFKELNVAEYTTKYGDYYGLMFAGAEIATKELQEENLKLEAKVRTLEIEQNYCLPNCSKVADLEEQIVDLKDFVLKVSKFLHNNNNVRPDNLVHKERDVLLIKELKLFEKWELQEEVRR